MATRHVLLIEDDPDIAELLQHHIEAMGHFVQPIADGVRGLSVAIQSEWDLVMLDLNLPSCDGIDICREIRHAKPMLGIIILTARKGEAEQVIGFDSGADDYITKPFSTVELGARIKAIFRRIDLKPVLQKTDKILTTGDIVVNLRAREVAVNDEPISLTAKEFELLIQFMESPNQVFRRADLLDLVWGYSYDGYLHTVNTHINRLRHKIEPDPKQPKYIKTVWGVGYKLSV